MQAVSPMRIVRAPVLALVAASVFVAPSAAKVRKIIVDQVVSPAFCKGDVCQTFAGVGHFEQISGRAFGELDPADPLNALIQDIQLAKDKDGKVRYVATFVITKPVDMSKASGLMWHDAPNRGRPPSDMKQERLFGDIGLASAWQGDNASSRKGLGTAVGDVMAASANHWLQLPVVRNSDGSPVTGKVFARIINRSGPQAQALLVQTNPVPYMPATMDTRQASLVSRTHETLAGKVGGETAIAADDWKFCGGGTFDKPEPLTRLPVRICLKGGFDASKLYQVVYTARDPYPLGVGFAAWRDVASFFKHEKQDDEGTANPLAGHVRYSIARGRSQAGNYLRGSLHLGFNQDEAQRRVHDGMWAIIAGRRIALNFRWAQPDGVLEIYQAGSEGPQWWGQYPDAARNLPARGIQDRCAASNTCPKIIEHFGSAEIWGLKLGPAWYGTDARQDIPLPANVRRYYIASSSHGGGSGGIKAHLADYHKSAKPPACPGNNWGLGVLADNPISHDEPWRAITVHFRDWVMKDSAPPPSRYPTLREGQLVAPDRSSMGFPNLADLPAHAPGPDLINPLLDYDWGSAYDPNDASGVPETIPPGIRQVLPSLVPKVDGDGNELGGIPVVMLMAPLGTYLGWNITADGARPFHKGKLCSYRGGMIAFARTRAERLARNDPRPSLEERYGDHAGFVRAVEAAVVKAKAAGFLLDGDGAAIVNQARSSNVLK